MFNLKMFCLFICLISQPCGHSAFLGRQLMRREGISLVIALLAGSHVLLHQLSRPAVPLLFNLDVSIAFVLVCYILTPVFAIFCCLRSFWAWMQHCIYFVHVFYILKSAINICRLRCFGIWIWHYVCTCVFSAHQRLWQAQRGLQYRHVQRWRARCEQLAWKHRLPCQRRCAQREKTG